jgi:hypothetical protein
MSGQSPALAFTTLRILWGGIISSTLLFLVALGVVEHPDELAQPILLPILGLTAAGTAAVAFVLPPFLYRQGLNAQKPNIALQEQPDPEAPEGFGRTVRLPVDAAAAQRSIMAAYFTKTILGCALGEAACLLGFVLGFLGGSTLMVLPCFAMGWLAIGYHFPRDAAMMGPAKEVLGISRLSLSRQP